MGNQYLPFSPGAVITDLYYGNLEKISCEAAGESCKVEIEIKREQKEKKYLLAKEDIEALEKELAKYDRNEYKATRRKFERIKNELEKKKSGKKSILSRLGLGR